MYTVQKDEVRSSPTVLARDFDQFWKHCVNLKLGSKSEPQQVGLRHYQSEFAKVCTKHKYVVTPKYLQGGFTTVSLALALWKAVFNKETVVAYYTIDVKEATEILDFMVAYFPEEVLSVEYQTSKDEGEGSSYRKFASGGEIHIVKYSEGFVPNKTTDIFLDEVAYVDRHHYFKILWPSLLKAMQNATGNVVAFSVPNGDEGWFYSLVHDDPYAHFLCGSLDDFGQPRFKLHRVGYKDCPLYHDPVTLRNLKSSLGEAGFMQKMECRFFTYMPADACTWRYINQTDVVKDNFVCYTNQPEKIVYSCEDTVIEEPPLKLDRSKTKGVPVPEDVCYLAIDSKDDGIDDDYFRFKAKKIKKQQKEDQYTAMEWGAISDIADPELLKLAGIKVNKADSKVENFRDRLLAECRFEGMPKEIILKLNKNALSINGVPTKIPANAIEMAYSGLAYFVGEEEAAKTVGGYIRERLQKLF